MKYSRFFFSALLIGSVSAATVGIHREAAAKEPMERFLDNLRRLEMHDMAVLYLESLRTKESLDPELKAILPYEEGVSLVAGSRNNRDMTLRMKQLDDATARFNEFVKNNAKHPRAVMANTQLGNVLVERAKVEFEKSKKPLNAGQKDKLLAESRKFFTEAQKVLEDAEKQLEAAEKAFPKVLDAKTQAAIIKQRDQVRLDFMQARLFAASVVYEHSKAYDDKDPKRKELLLESAKRYESINQRWRTMIAGLYALLWAGRSHQEAGDYKKALGMYQELIALDGGGEPTIQSLTAQSVQLAITCWIHDSQKQYDEAIKVGEEWIAKAKGAHTSADGLGVHWMIVQAQEFKIAAVKDDAAKKRPIVALAMKHAKQVAAFDNEHRKAALEWVARNQGRGQVFDTQEAWEKYEKAQAKSTLPAPVLAALKIEADKRDDEQKTLLTDYYKENMAGGPPATFDEARTQAQTALETSQVFKQKADAATNDKDKKDNTAQQLAEEKKSYDLFQLAMSLKDKGEEPAQIDLVNRVRYMLCYLNFRKQNYYDAAIMGEYLANRYPGSSGARPAAKIALASFVQTYNLSPPKTRGVDVAQMERMANLIVNRWTGEPEADEALMTLADIHLRADRLDEATKLLARVTETSPTRPMADIKAGQALWGQFIRQSATAEEGSPDLSAKRTEAEKLLKKGADSLRSKVAANAPPSYSLLTAEVSLAQLYIETSRAPLAVALLEHKPQGLLEMVKSDEATQGNLRPETYKAALRAYVSVERVEDAQKMMDALDQEYKSKESADKLTRIYITLGKELEGQLKSEADKDKKKKLQDSFETFLKRIADRPGNNFATLNWIGETFYALGSATENREQPTVESKKYFASANAAFGKILTEMRTTPAFGPQESRDQHLIRLQVKLANCSRRTGDYAPAITALSKILEANPMSLEAQLEGALTFQSWGAKDPAKYKLAMLGDGKYVNPKTKQQAPLIWGWAHMAKTLQRSVGTNENLAGYFHEARYNLAKCRYLQASASTSAADKKASLERAEKDILVVARLYPELGGQNMKERYTTLFSMVLKAEGKPGSLESILAAADAAAKNFGKGPVAGK